MGMIEDAELLRQYTETGSEDAFTELVRRYLPLVYSAALRQVRGDESLAGRELLGGWLYNSTRLAAFNAMRVNQRRIIREQKAVAMQETAEHSEANGDLKLVL